MQNQIKAEFYFSLPLHSHQSLKSQDSQLLRVKPQHSTPTGIALSFTFPSLSLSLSQIPNPSLFLLPSLSRRHQ